MVDNEEERIQNITSYWACPMGDRHPLPVTLAKELLGTFERCLEVLRRAGGAALSKGALCSLEK